MRFFWTLIFLPIGIFLSACTANSDSIPATLTVIPVTLTATQPQPTETLLPTRTQSPTPTLAAPTLTDTATPKPVLQLCSPLAEQTLQEIPEIVSDPYNPPRPGSDARHHGTDFSYYRRRDRTTIEGEGVQALMAGQVVAVVQDQLPYGNMVIIETQRSLLPPEIIDQFGIDVDDSLYILYAHFGNPPLVALGEQVDCGQTIGDVGTTGYNIVNPHLHLETRIGPAGIVFVDGMVYYDTGSSDTERANYELWRTSGDFRHFDPMSLIETYLQNWVEK